MLAFSALDNIATQIAKDVCNATDMAGTQNIVIFDQSSFANIQAYAAFKTNVSLLTASYNNIKIPVKSNVGVPGAPAKTTSPELNVPQIFHQMEQGMYKQQQLAAPPANGAANLQDVFAEKAYNYRQDELLPAAPAAPASGGGGQSPDYVSDGTSLLQAIAASSTSETANTGTFPDSALDVLLTQKLKMNDKCKGKAIVYPPLYGHGSVADFAKADVESDLAALNVARTGAYDRLNQYLGTDSVTTITQQQSMLEAQFTEINTLYDSVMNNLLQANSSGVIGSAAVIQGRSVAQLLHGHVNKPIPPDADHSDPTPDPKPNAAPAYVLLASIVSAGGTERDHKTFWTNLTVGDQITYSGGAIVNFSLWKQPSLVPEYAYEVRFRTPFLRINSPCYGKELRRARAVSFLHCGGPFPHGTAVRTIAVASPSRIRFDRYLGVEIYFVDENRYFSSMDGTAHSKRHDVDQRHLEEKTLQPLDNPFGPKVLPMS